MFSHTQNENGTYNTLCLFCFMTIASSAASLEELQEVELHHLCLEKVLSELLARRSSAEPLAPIR